MRELTMHDAAEVGALLAEAFVDDPPIVWLFPDPADRVEGMREVFTANARLAMHVGSGVLTDDGGGVGLFTPPSAVVDDAALDAAGLPAAVAQMPAERQEMLGRFLGTLSELHQRSMTEPHWSLAFLGSRPSARGTGQAAQVVDELSRRADATGHPCFLDTLNAWNVGYYERRGYRVIDEAKVPDSPLTAWAMRRG